jgi:hypothetical protein
MVLPVWNHLLHHRYRRSRWRIPFQMLSRTDSDGTHSNRVHSNGSTTDGNAGLL